MLNGRKNSQTIIKFIIKTEQQHITMQQCDYYKTTQYILSTDLQISINSQFLRFDLILVLKDPCLSSFITSVLSSVPNFMKIRLVLFVKNLDTAKQTSKHTGKQNLHHSTWQRYHN